MMVANVMMATNLKMEDVFQSVMQIQFGKLELVSVLLNIHSMEALADSAQLIHLLTKIKHPVSVMNPLMFMMKMETNVWFAQPIQCQMQIGQDVIVLHSM